MKGLRTTDKEKSQQSSQYTTVQTPVIEKQAPVDFIQPQIAPKEYTRDGFTIGIARTFEEIAAIHPLWYQMQSNESMHIPNVDYNRYLSVLEAIDGKVEPFVMYFKQDNEPIAMVIGRIEKNPLALKLGYLTMFRPKPMCLNIIYGGIMGEPDEKLSSLLINELTAQLKFRQADMILFHHLKTDTAFYDVLRSRPDFLTRDRFPKTDEHWRMSIPDNIDKFYKARSRGHRHNLRRAISKFEEENADVRYVHYSTEDEVDDFLKTAACISEKTYQHALNAGLIDDENTRSRIKAAAENGWFRGHIIFVGDKPCAFQLALKYENIYYMVNIGYDPAFSSYKPGLILFLKVLEHICADPSIDTLDFYFGDAEYKNRYGTEHWQEASVYLFAPRVYPIFINILQNVMTATNTGLKHVIGKMGFVDRIKRKWRNLLRTPKPDTAKANTA